jgi:hypothetical protein
MDTLWKFPGALLATSALLVCGCANDSVRLHDMATKAMLESRKVDQERKDIAMQPRAAATKSYTHPDYRWSVSYPGDWQLNDNDRFVKLSRGQAILGIHALTDVAGKSLDEVADGTVKAWEQHMRNVNTFKRVSRQRVTLAGDLTAIAIVHHIGTGQVGKSQKIILVVKDRRFLIDAETLLASWPDYERDFNQIIDSFRVIE